MIRPLTCPVCQKELPADGAHGARWLPFCSERCRNVDLYRWSEGRYAIVEPLAPDQAAELDALNDPGFAE